MKIRVIERYSKAYSIIDSDIAPKVYDRITFNNIPGIYQVIEVIFRVIDLKFERVDVTIEKIKAPTL